MAEKVFNVLFLCPGNPARGVYAAFHCVRPALAASRCPREEKAVKR